MNYILLFLTLPLTIFCVLFAVSNTQDVTVSLLTETWEAPFSAVALSMMGAGFFFGALFVWMHTHKTRFEHWKHDRHIARLEKELTAFQKKNEPP